MKNVKISRKRWTRGGDGELRTDSGQSCCLGFVARAYGLRTPTNSSTFSGLADFEQDLSVLPEKLRPVLSPRGEYIDSELHDDLTETNDDCEIRGAEREKRITKLLAKAGVKAVFID